MDPVEYDAIIYSGSMFCSQAIEGEYMEPQRPHPPLTLTHTDPTPTPSEQNRTEQIFIRQKWVQHVVKNVFNMI